jgi:hypothetical protein
VIEPVVTAILNRRVFCASLALAGCVRPDDGRLGHVLYVLIDMSGSYISHAQGAVQMLGSLLLHIRGGDRVVVAVIQSCSFADSGVIAQATFDAEQITRNEQVTTLFTQVSSFVANPTSVAGFEDGEFLRYTDIRGAFLEASQSLQQFQARRKVLVVMSDLVETPTARCAWPGDESIQLGGAQVLLTEITRTEEDRANPEQYGQRLERWRSWLVARSGVPTFEQSGADVVRLVERWRSEEAAA